MSLLPTKYSRTRFGVQQQSSLSGDEYAKRSFRGFPIRYWDKLQSFRFEKKDPINVLNIGCGPGNWAIAAATYNRNASVVGIDKNEHFLQLAAEYGRRLNAPNVEFVKLDYRQIPKHFETESFDYIFTVNALQYFDESPYFEIVSRVLKKAGTLLIFRTETIGWFLEKFIRGIKERNLPNVVSTVPAVIAGVAGQRFPSKTCEHVVTFRRTKRIAMHYGIELKNIQHSEKLLCFPSFFDMVGKRLVRLS